MDKIKNHNISLRALEPEDLEFLYDTENDPDFWEVSNTQVPYSRHLLKKYLNNSHQDIYEAKQLRLVIINSKTGERLGFTDLFDFQPQHHRAGIGILILRKFQQKGYATEALKVFLSYAFTKLDLHQIYAHIPTDNQESVKLFEKIGFKKIGFFEDWLRINQTYKSVYFYQFINNQNK